MRDKLRAKLTMYRLRGFPLAFQVWFYECCSTVDKKNSSRVDNSVQCTLNWQVKGCSSFMDLASGKLMTSIYQLKYRNITPISEEKLRLNITTFFEDVNIDDVPLEEKTIFHNDHFNVVPQFIHIIYSNSLVRDPVLLRALRI